MAAPFVLAGHYLEIASGRRSDWALRAGPHVLGREPLLSVAHEGTFGRRSGLGISRARSLTYLDITHLGTAGENLRVGYLRRPAGGVDEKGESAE